MLHTTPAHLVQKLIFIYIYSAHYPPIFIFRNSFTIYTIHTRNTVIYRGLLKIVCASNVHDWFMYFHSTFFYILPWAISFLLTSWHHLAPTPRPTNPSPTPEYITTNVGSLRVASHSTIITRFQVTTCNYRSAAALEAGVFWSLQVREKLCILM